jgi:hypothetical protein
MNSWRSAKSPLVNYAMPNKWFKEMGLYQIDNFKTEGLASYYLMNEKQIIA